MKIEDIKISDVKIITPMKFDDKRGWFVKIYNREEFIKKNLNMNIEEIFYSFSKKNVIRGFHFQNPPFDLDKLVWVTEGAILDVVLDIRKGSLTYGQHHSVEISAGNKKMVYMSKGIAHAFLTLSENATVFYATSKIFSKEHDTGIKWDTVGFRWPVDEPVISGKDDNLVSFKDFQSPFEMVNIQ